MPIIPLTNEEYLEYAQNQPELPLWQSLGWKTYQESLGRKTRLLGLKNASGKIEVAALIIIDRTVFGLSTWDIPRGPTGDPEFFEELLLGIVEEAKKERGMAVYFSPFSPSDRVFRAGKPPNLQIFKSSRRHEHPEATLLLDLTKSDEELLREMKEKGRYNIRLAQRYGITVEQSWDTNAFYALLQKTSRRDRYGIKPKVHYEKFLSTLTGSFLLLAYEHSGTHKKPTFAESPTLGQQGTEATVGRALAGLMGVIFGEMGIYYYGASDHAERAKMAPSLLQFEAMKFCRAQGAARYDLFGIDPPINTGTGAAMNRASASAELSTGSASSGSWAGVTKFKKQFGGEVVMYPPEREVTLMPIIKILMKWKRKVVG